MGFYMCMRVSLIVANVVNDRHIDWPETRCDHAQYILYFTWVVCAGGEG
jgi:hypothetical protein